MRRSLFGCACAFAFVSGVAGCGASAAAPVVASPPAATSRAAGDAAAAAAAFAALGALAGDWQATTSSGAVIRASYRLVSNGTVLVETWTTPSGKETLTVFHRDGARLVATHYCAQGNQPRLALAASANGEYDFGFFDATNLENKADSHLVRLHIALRGEGRFDKTEVYEERGAPDATTFAFTRATATRW